MAGSFVPSEELPYGSGGPPWTPAVWHVPPEQLVEDARAQLFSDRAHLDGEVLGRQQLAMSGAETSPMNETELRIDAAAPRQSRAQVWHHELHQLYRTSPTIWSGNPVGNVNPSSATSLEDGPPAP